MLEVKLASLKRHFDEVGRDYNNIRKGISFRVLIGCDKNEVEAKLSKVAEIRGTTVEALRNRMRRLWDSYSNH